MPYDWTFTADFAKEMDTVGRHDGAFLTTLLLVHLREIQQQPYEAGKPKSGSLAGARAREIKHRNVVYRWVYVVQEDVKNVHHLAFGPHDDAYRDATSRYASFKKGRGSKR